ncbi:MAG: hypothetical protein JNM03_09570 [Sphingopyxis sp.]|uniref:hypothetical protein n=1 Tax=Sphingopyxis sp. TaxID=1908224 RepID=UPI001A613C94|nr:hypothetical protein [Sphingopyxis sp.]MBL9070226.1 hypothetical protein [Sphingopyxis sp.]
MANRLKAYVRRTILDSAKEGAWPKRRRTEESTRIAFMDAMRGTDTGWWSDLIYTADMLEMSHRYRNDIAAALSEYRDASGESYTYRERYSGDGPDRTAEDILSALMRRKAWTYAEYQDAEAPSAPVSALIGLRFAVEWYAGELAREYCPDL